jgi:hypothetical protein
MAESSLSIGYAELRQVIANYLGLGLTVSAWSTTEVAQIELIIKSALRQFYFPPPIIDEFNQRKVYEWTFLEPVREMDTIAPYSDGTVAIDNGATTVTLTDGVWPDWTATNGSLIIGTTEYFIASRTSDTELELTSAYPDDTETEATYVLQHDGNYDLEDDFGSIIGNLVIESENYKPDIVIVGEGKIRSLRQSGALTAQSNPVFAAVRPKEHTDTTTGQRFEIMFYPLPDDVYTISYKMGILPQMLVDTTLEYPYGGAMHAETLRAGCVAAAEEQENGNRLDGRPTYDKKKLFEERLAASIALDKNQLGIDFYGYNGDNSDARHRPLRGTHDRRRCRDNTLVTYNGSIT